MVFTDEALCDTVTGLFGIVGLVTLILFIIFFAKRHNAAIATRHPAFTSCHCIISILYFCGVLPLTCLIDESPFLLWYLPRALVMFGWFWVSMCRYVILSFDYNYVCAIRIAATSKQTLRWNNFRKKDYGNPKLCGIMIGIYFVACFIGLLVACFVAIKPPFTTWDTDDTKKYTSPSDMSATSTSIFIVELIFVVMCLLPFLIIMIWVPFQIWDIHENWKIRDELVFFFIGTSILFFWDAASTAFALFLPFQYVMGIKLVIEAIILTVTIAICTLWVLIVIPSDKVNKAPAPEELARLSTKEPQSLKGGRNAIPLAYVLVNKMGYNAFFQHCVDEINVENLLFLAEICFFKKCFLERLKKLHHRNLNSLTREDHDRDNSLDSNRGQNGQFDNPNNSSLRKIDQRMNDRDLNQYNKFDNVDENSQDAPHLKKVVWSPSNSLAILTIKMKHGLDQLPTIKSDENDKNQKNENKLIKAWKKSRNKSRNRKKQNKRIASSSQLQGYTFSHVSNPSESLRLGLNNSSIQEEFDDFEEIPLYIMGYGLYLKFIKEGGEMEINISSKTRALLHDFFAYKNMFATAGGTTPGDTPGHIGSNSSTPRGPVVTPGGHHANGHFAFSSKNNKTNNNNTRGGPAAEDSFDNQDLYVYENLRERENPTSAQSLHHLYKLYHIFDGAWAEIFHLVVSNVYPRFTSSAHYKTIKDKLESEMEIEKDDLFSLVTEKADFAFGKVKPRSLVIIGVQKKLPGDEQRPYFGKPAGLSHAKKGNL